MAFSVQDKINNMKQDRSLAINAKNTIIKERANVLEENNFNDTYFTGDSTYFGINTLMYYYYLERKYLGGDTLSLPDYDFTPLSQWWDIWSARFNLASTSNGDGVGGLFPPDENGAPSQELNIESPIVNNNGDSRYAPFTAALSSGDTYISYERHTSFLSYVSDALNALGDTAVIGDTLVSGYVYDTDGEATAAARVVLYGSSGSGIRQTYNRFRTGWGILGRRTCGIKIEWEYDGISKYRYKIGADQTANQSDFYADNTTDINGVLGDIAHKTDLLTALSGACSKGSSSSDLVSIWNELIDGYDKIQGISGDTSTSPDWLGTGMFDDIGDSYQAIVDTKNAFSALIGSSGDSYYNGGDTTLYGLYSYFNTVSSGADAYFDGAVQALLKICRTGDTNLEQLAWGRYNGVSETNLSNDAVVYYDFNKGDSTGDTLIVFDRSGDTRSGTATSTSMLTTDTEGYDGRGGAYFSDAHGIVVGSNENYPLCLTTQNQWTIFIRVKMNGTTQTNSDASVFTYGRTSNKLNITIDGTTTSMRFTIVDGGTNVYNAIPTGFSSVFDDSWHSIGITCKNGSLTFYLDGDSKTTGSSGTYDLDRLGSNGMQLGGDIEGYMDDFYIFPRALLSEEVYHLHGNSYLGGTYKTSEGDITVLRKWRLLFIKSIVGKPQGTTLAYEALGDALDSAQNQLDIATEQLQNILGDSDIHHYKYIVTPKLLTAFFDAKRDLDTGAILQRKVSVAYDGQQHATSYIIMKKTAPQPSSTEITNDQWISGYTEFTQGDTDEEKGFIKNIYTDVGDTNNPAKDTQFVYRVQVIDESEKVGGDTIKSLQSDIFYEDTEKIFTCTAGDSQISFGDSHDFSRGKYIVVNNTTSSNGYYYIENAGDTFIRISPVMQDTSGKAYDCPSVIRIQE